MNNYIIYDAITGAVRMTIQTDDPVFVSLNTPTGYRSMISNATALAAIDKVNVATKKIILKKPPTPNLGGVNKSPLSYN